MSGKVLTDTTAEVYSALEPLSSDERQRVLKAALALLNEVIEGCNDGGLTDKSARSSRELDDRNGPGDCGGANDLGEVALRWMRQNQIDRSSLDQLYHIDGGSVELITPVVAGATRKEKAINCYLLVGLRSLLANDHAVFPDKEAIAFCHQTDAYDRNNHTTNRKALGNRMSGDRASGFTLTVPGLRDAAKLVKEMTSNNHES